MPPYSSPGVYIEEVASGPRPIEAVGTSTAGFVGQAPNVAARQHEAVAINNWTQFVREFAPPGSTSTPLAHAVFGFFLNGGRRCYVVKIKNKKKK
jgi:phage tail sheath protein FI